MSVYLVVQEAAAAPARQKKRVKFDGQGHHYEHTACDWGESVNGCTVLSGDDDGDGSVDKAENDDGMGTVLGDDDDGDWGVDKADEGNDDDKDGGIDDEDLVLQYVLRSLTTSYWKSNSNRLVLLV